MTDSAITQSLLESDALRVVCGNIARPGGLSLTESAVNACRLKKGDRILDLGCGEGVSVEHLKTKYKLNAIGIDPSPVMLKRAYQRTQNLTVFQGKAEFIPIKNQTLDAVLTECALSRYECLTKALNEIHRILKENGKLIISDIYAREVNRDFDEASISQPVRRFRKKNEILSLLNSSGFEIISFQDKSPLLSQLILDIIMTYGSMDKFWAKSSCYLDRCAYSIPGIKLGYYSAFTRKSS